jgi:hypothetical protein
VFASFFQLLVGELLRNELFSGLSNAGNLAMFAAIRRASSSLSNLAAERRPGSLS